ncbi:hypothetical protein BJF79_18995 [Actinomadura sp. CNU-125]|uniref:hypothetical protein n=1 Tax=Actinomadura sp. CNU-125 TaxID=1904961 RepID=UPI000964BDF7|nr:hypothetical protein [Actinomadura sp. CNU-125]OLT14552.1 hypothetical protein BJF79_18995 [Actinomadura sp. CNU-125]
MMRTPRRVAGLLTAVPLAAVLTVAAAPQAAADPLTEELCAGPVADLKAVQARIRAHNARPSVSSSQSYVNSYNAEAATLRREQNQAISRLMDCEKKLDRVKARYPRGEFMKPTNDATKKIDAAHRGVTDEEKRAVTHWSPKTYEFLRYGQGKAGMTKRLDRRPPKLPPSVQRVYKALDETRPSFPPTAYLQGVRAPRTGTPDPAYPSSSGRRIGSVHMDHIVPLRRLVAFPDFLKLTPRNMFIVANSPANAQWLSGSSNLSKGSGSAAFASGTSPAWRREQAKLREKAETELKELIDVLLKNQRS